MQNKEQRVIEPKVFGLLLENQATVFLSVQYAYSLEEAFLLAKLEFEKQNPMRRGVVNPLMGAKIGLFSIKTVQELLNSPSLNDLVDPKIMDEIGKIQEAANKTRDLPVPEDLSPDITKPISEIFGGQAKKNKDKTSEISEKNSIMQKIVESKDKELFEKNKKLFSKAERSYLKERIK